MGTDEEFQEIEKAKAANRQVEVLDPRISNVDTKGVDLIDIADQLENETLNLPKNDEGYLAELSNNATYLYQAYKEIGNVNKSRKWASEVNSLISYLKPIRKNFLCKKHNIVC